MINEKKKTITWVSVEIPWAIKKIIAYNIRLAYTK